MLRKVEFFCIQGFSDADFVVDVGLAAVLDSDVAETQWHVLSHEQALGIGASVHDVNFGYDAHRSNTILIYLLSHL